MLAPSRGVTVGTAPPKSVKGKTLIYAFKRGSRGPVTAISTLTTRPARCDTDRRRDQRRKQIPTNKVVRDDYSPVNPKIEPQGYNYALGGFQIGPFGLRFRPCNAQQAM